MSASIATLFTVVIYLGFFLYDLMLLPLIGLGVKKRLPEKAEKHMKLSKLDLAFINFNKVISALFVYHCILFAKSSMNVDFFDVPALKEALMWFPLHFPAIVIVYDFFYTILHWALHIPVVYPLIHKHHHRQLVPFRGNLDAINVHPIEYVLGEYNHLLAIFLFTKILGQNVPVHAITFFLYVAIAGLLSSLNHTRFDINIPYVYQVWWHDYHHRQPRCNYGQYIMLWDAVFGWFKERDVDQGVASSAPIASTSTSTSSKPKAQ